MLNNFDLMKYGTHALVSYGGMLAYDVLVEGKSISEGFTMSDAATFAISSVVADVSYDVLSGLVPYINEGSMTGMLANHILQAVVYMYLYDVMVDKKYPYYRSKSSALYVGAILSILLGYFQNPILSIFGLRSY